MDLAKGKRIFRTVYIILTIIGWMTVFGRMFLSEQIVQGDDLFGYAGLIIVGFVFLMILLSQLGTYCSIAYLVFEPQKKWWKFVIYLAILAVSMITFAHYGQVFRVF